MAYVFVLWSEGFDEKVATIFVTELRDAGLLVKMVGLTTRHTSGFHGLVLVPDLTLDHALPLASRTSCLIIPSILGWSSRLDNDPRVRKFIKLASSNQALLVVGQQNVILQMGLKAPVLIQENIKVYPDNEEIMTFARELAQLLSKKTG
ncbi:MAG: hypothetical protein KDI79_11445 [Anaerolineae bacterium]|nr:hypothetical protein [Anaerolineae bacterium]